MNTFIRAIEVWVPSTDRTLLEFGGGLYGDAKRFGALSKTLCFGRGEGLPGQAWEQGKPIVLKAFDGSYFKRTAAAHADGITRGVALPIFAGDFLTSVLVIFSGDDASNAGGVELWQNDPAGAAEMAKVDGYLGGDAAPRKPVTRGEGLPGMAWDSGLPVFQDKGFAIPCAVRAKQNYVATFLSGKGTPIARRLEIWCPDAARETLLLTAGFSEGGALKPSEAGLEMGQGTIGKVFLTGVPAVSDNAASEPGGSAAAAAGLESLVAIPVLNEGRLAAVVGWYF